MTTAPVELMPPGDPLPVGLPASLRRQAPVSVVVTPERGGPAVPFGPGGIALRSGKRYVLRVVTARPDESGRVERVRLEPDEHVTQSGTAAQTPLEGGSAEFAIRFTARLKRPFPATFPLAVCLEHGRWGECPFTTPAVVWPSFGNQVFWGLCSVLLPVIATRISSQWLGGTARSLRQVLAHSLSDIEFWTESGVVAVALTLLLSLAGWAWVVFFAEPEG